MKETTFTQIINNYEEALYLIDASPHDTEEWIKLLQVRDTIGILQSNKKITKLPKSLAKLIELDNKFVAIVSKQKPSNISFFSGQLSIQSTPNTWWWSLDQIQTKIKDANLYWLWKFLIASCIVMSIALILDVIPKLLINGPDLLGGITLATQATLIALSAGGTFSSVGSKMFDGFLQRVDIPFKLWTSIKVWLAIFILLIPLIIRLSMPEIAIMYNNHGVRQYDLGYYSSAERNFHRSLNLNPDYPEAHYNLGLIYEDLHDYERARTEYSFAMMGGLDAANNNLGRLYILDNDFSSAISVLLPALNKVSDIDIHYDLLKNLGWARLMQERYDEAETYLLDATIMIPDKAPAHCLLAQVYYFKDLSEKEVSSWNYCIIYASNSNADEDSWLNLARKRLKELDLSNES